MKVVFIAKTHLDTDGRILNELSIIQKQFPDTQIDFILLPDKPVTLDLGSNIILHELHLLVRHSRALRFMALIEFTLRSLILLLRLKPSTLHVQDSAVALPALLYRILRGNSFKLIYDDHEIPNESRRLETRLYSVIERELMKRSDYIISANKERMNLLRESFKYNAHFSYLLNLPYFEKTEEELVEPRLGKQLAYLDSLRSSGTKLIIHQGVLAKERGRNLLADFSQILPDDFKILLLGGNRADFDKFLGEYSIDDKNFVFIGSVNYRDLDKFWRRGVASIVMYLPTYINNRLCAPNRLYISVKLGLPVIVNKDNPVLSAFIRNYECGFYIDDITSTSDFNALLQVDTYAFVESYNQLRQEQIDSFVEIYRR